MFTNTLPASTKTILEKTKILDFLKKFYLSGGTALTLQLGHRESEDLDFFTDMNFQPEAIQTELEQIGKLESVEISQGTLNCFLDGVKLQFLSYLYPLLEPLVEWENIKVASKLDIACTKLITISSRGSKKDFIDLYFLLQNFKLPFLFEKLKEKYPKTDYNETHVLKSLVYFTDADHQPLPRMHREVSWEEVKEKITREAKSFRL